MANVLSVIVVGTLVIFLANGVLAKAALRVADAVFLQMDGLIEEGVEQPTETLATGSEQSLISWDSIGRQGKDFIALGPTQKAIGNFWNQEAMRPLRVYVGLSSKDTSEERAKLALAELRNCQAWSKKGTPFFSTTVSSSCGLRGRISTASLKTCCDLIFSYGVYSILEEGQPKDWAASVRKLIDGLRRLPIPILRVASDTFATAMRI